MKIVKNKSTENCLFYSREKSLNVVWACFRNAPIRLLFHSWHRFSTNLSKMFRYRTVTSHFVAGLTFLSYH